MNSMQPLNIFARNSDNVKVQARRVQLDIFSKPQTVRFPPPRDPGERSDLDIEVVTQPGSRVPRLLQREG